MIDAKDQAVLDAMSRFTDTDLIETIGGAICFPNHPYAQATVAAFQAELDRRTPAKPKDPTP